MEILHKSGYSIDIIDFDSRDLRLELEKYQLVVGFGYAMESATSKSNILKIAYFNGFNLDFSNKINIKKIGELSKNIQYIFLNSSRIILIFILKILTQLGIIFCGLEGLVYRIKDLIGLLNCFQNLKMFICIFAVLLNLKRISTIFIGRNWNLVPIFTFIILLI